MLRCSGPPGSYLSGCALPPTRHLVRWQDFWHVVFNIAGSALPKVIPRALMLTCFGGIAAVLNYFDYAWRDGNEFLEFSTIVVGLLISFRLNFAYTKWERAMKSVLDMRAERCPTHASSARCCCCCSSLLAALRSHRAPLSSTGTLRRGW